MSDETKPVDLAAARGAIEKARSEVQGLCDGRVKFTMCIPPQKDTDTDFVIFAGLEAGASLVDALEQAQKENKSLRQLLKDVLEMFDDDLEWAASDELMCNRCPDCNKYSGGTHKPDCRLNNMVMKIRETIA